MGEKDSWKKKNKMEGNWDWDKEEMEQLPVRSTEAQKSEWETGGVTGDLCFKSSVPHPLVCNTSSFNSAMDTIWYECTGYIAVLSGQKPTQYPF